MKKLLYHLVGRVPRDGSLSTYISSLKEKENEYPWARVITFFMREQTKID